MKTAKLIAAGAFGFALALANSGLSQAQSQSEVALAPLRASSIDLGAKHLVSFFVAVDNACRLTVMIADSVEEKAEAPVSRLQLSIDPGKSARVDTADGAAAAFSCGDDAKSMRLAKIERVAAAPTIQ